MIATLSRMASASPLGFRAGDENLYRFVGNDPVNGLDPTGLADIDVPHVFQFDPDRGTGTDPVFTLSADITGGQLTIKVLEAKAFAKESTNKGYPFSSVVTGSAKDKDGFHDTDSVQVAVRWSTATNPDVGHATNALPAGKKRDQGADWTLGGKAPKQTATWATKVPDGATHVDVIIIYTDTIYGPGHVEGDLPLVIGSFSGNLSCEKWTMKANTDDLFKARKNQPAKKDFPALLAATEKILKDKTGYQLQVRTEINDASDTGYDIVLRK